MANVPADDADLEHLLTRLLRMLSPAPAAGDMVLAGHGGRALHPAGNGGAGVPHQDPLPADGVPANPMVPARGDAPSAALTVSGSEARALIELVSARGIAQGELAGLLGLDKSTVSRLAAGLERKGWVRRGRDEGNQRYVRMYLTPEGAEVAARVWQAWQSRQERILARLSEDERAGLAAGLQGLIRGLAADRLSGEGAGSSGPGFR